MQQMQRARWALAGQRQRGRRFWRRIATGVATAAAVSMGAALAMAQEVGSSSGLADGDVERGRVIFARCSGCHDIGRGAAHRTGPHLNNLFDRTAGAVDGYAASLPLVAAGLRGLVWTDDTLFAYLNAPQVMVPGTDMPLIGLDDPQDRADLLAFLHAATEPETSYRTRPSAISQ